MARAFGETFVPSLKAAVDAGELELPRALGSGRELTVAFDLYAAETPAPQSEEAFHHHARAIIIIS